MTLSARDAYRDELTKLAMIDEKIICIEADLGGKSHPFQKHFPGRFFNMGIAESAAIDIATGLAKAGFKPFFSTFSPFAVLRAAESIKLSLGYMASNIKIVAPYAGCAGAWFGTTHHCLEDIAIIQSFPGIFIAAPYGEEETRSVIRDAAQTPQPFYIRMGRNNQYKSLTEVESKSKQVIYHRHLKNHGICLVSIGEEGTRICNDIINEMPFISHSHLIYLDQQTLIEFSKINSQYYSHFIIVEEHRLAGGIGTLLATLMQESTVIPFSVNDDWPSIGGSHMDILEYLNFTKENLINLINQLPRIHHARIND